MSLYGALFGGVSGLKAQGSKIGVISDNIANVNTVGYKQSEALFETMVVNANSTVSYQTGGVRGESRMAVDKQGLLLSTDSPTDIAISGGGFFTVNAKVDGAGQPLYTRAGSFRQDNLGNFVNAAGFFLQGWPLDRDGRLPGEVGNLNTTSFANLDSLETVNVKASSGVAQATTLVSLGANLDAGERIYPGMAGKVTMDVNNPRNFGINAASVIVPAEYGLATANSIVRGDMFEVLTGNGLNYAYEYGGFSIGRSISTATPAANFGDGMNDNSRIRTSTAVTDIVARADGLTLRINIPNHGLITGDQVSLSGLAAPLGATTNPNVSYTVTWVDANTVDVVTAPPHGLGADTDVGIVNTTAVNYNVFNGNIFDATSATQAFFGNTGVARFTTAARSFTIQTSTDTHTFTYTPSSPNTSSGQFNNLNSLAAAINDVTGLTARVTNGRLVVGAEDANEQLIFTNGDSTTSTATQVGIDWISELDLANVTQGNRRFNSMQSLAALVNADEGVSAVIENPFSNASLDIRVDDPLDTIRFRDMQTAAQLTLDPGTHTFSIAAAAAGNPIDVVVDLGAGVDATTLFGISPGDFIVIRGEAATVPPLPATFPNTPGNVRVEVVDVDPVAGTFTYRIPVEYNPAGGAGYAGMAATAVSGGSVSVIGESNQGSILSELGIGKDLQTANSGQSLNGAAYVPQDTGVLGPIYDSSGAVGKNMASGDIVAQFSRNVRVYDALGAGHELRFSYIKTAENTWAVEIHAIPAGDVNSQLPNGQVATGTIQFNGDGSLRSVTAGLSNPITVAWTNGAIASTINLNLGTAGQPFGTPGAAIIGDTNGLSQFDSSYNVKFAEQNGAPVGELVSVSIDAEGYVIAAYSNGETQRLYKLPIADFANPNGLKAISGNVFAETRDSGTVNLREAGTNGVGDVVSASLEQSNVELSEQLTDMIVAQRAYQANTRVISTTDELLEELTRL